MGDMADMSIDNLLSEPWGAQFEQQEPFEVRDPLYHHTHVRFVRVRHATRKAVEFEFEPGIYGWVPLALIRNFKEKRQSMFVFANFWKTKRKELGIKAGGGLQKGREAPVISKSVIDGLADEAMGVYEPANMRLPNA